MTGLVASAYLNSAQVFSVSSGGSPPDHPNKYKRRSDCNDSASPIQKIGGDPRRTHELAKRLKVDEDTTAVAGGCQISELSPIPTTWSKKDIKRITNAPPRPRRRTSRYDRESLAEVSLRLDFDSPRQRTPYRVGRAVQRHFSGTRLHFDPESSPPSGGGNSA